MKETLETAYDVIITGAGMVGATLGCALGQKGMKVLLLDHSSPQPWDKKQGPDLRVSALNIASTNILKHLDVWPHIEKTRVCPFETMQIWEELREEMPVLETLPLLSRIKKPFNKTVFNCSDIDQPALGYIIENRVLQWTLHQCLQGMKNVTLLPNALIRDFPSLPDDNDKKICLEDGRCFTTPLLIGADGASSMTRAWAGIGVDRKEYGQKAQVALVEIADGPLCATWQAFVKTGPMALLPMPDCNGKHYASIVWYHQPEEIQRLMKISNPAFISELLNHFPKELPEIVCVCARDIFPLAKQHARQYVMKGIALVGDAAHTINPLAGQGVNLGMMDVAELTDVIIEAKDNKQEYWSEDVLKKYQKRRYKANRNMSWIIDSFYYGFSNDILPLKLARNTMLTLTNTLAPVTKHIEAYGAGIKGKLPTLAMPLK